VGRFLFPLWNKEERVIYKVGNDAMRKSAKYFLAGEYDKAEEVWRQQIRNRDVFISSKAYYNLAILYEIKGDYRKAFSFASRSHELVESSSLRQYIQFLAERVKSQKKIEEQMF